MTRDAVDELTTGSEDFAGIAAQFDAACVLDPTNDHAPVFKALTDFAEFVADSGDGGEAERLLAKCGITNSDGSGLLRNAVLTMGHSTSAGDLFPTGAPRGAETEAFLRNELRPELVALLAALEAAPSDFYYLVWVDEAHDVVNDSGDTVEARYLDYGDLCLLRATIGGGIAAIDMITAYDLGDVDPDVFDGPIDDWMAPLDADAQLARVQSVSRLVSGRTALTTAFQAYRTGAAAIRAETGVPRDSGILTFARVDAYERADAQADDLAFEAWGTGLVASLATTWTGTTYPDGSPIPAEDRVTIDFARFFSGVDGRAIYDLRYRDDESIEWHVGAGIADISSDMATAGGIFTHLGGLALTRNDFQNLVPGYPIYEIIASALGDTKTVDGSASDWTTSNSTEIGLSPLASLDLVRPIPTASRPGPISVASNATHVFLLIARAPAVGWSVLAQGDIGTVSVTPGFGDGGATQATVGSTVEIAIPRSSLHGFGGQRISLDVRGLYEGASGHLDSAEWRPIELYLDPAAGG